MKRSSSQANLSPRKETKSYVTESVANAENERDINSTYFTWTTSVTSLGIPAEICEYILKLACGKGCPKGYFILTRVSKFWQEVAYTVLWNVFHSKLVFSHYADHLIATPVFISKLRVLHCQPTTTDDAIARLTNLTALDSAMNINMATTTLLNLTNLTALSLHYGPEFSFSCITEMTELMYLTIHELPPTFSTLTRLKSLCLVTMGEELDEKISIISDLSNLEEMVTFSIDCQYLTCLKNLTSLILLSESKNMHLLSEFPNLTALRLYHLDTIVTSEIISHLSGLRAFSANQILDDHALRLLPNLTYLNTASDYQFSRNGLENLKYLKVLGLSSQITMEAMLPLTNITALDLETQSITNKEITRFTNLTALGISNYGLLTSEGISELTNLTFLDLDTMVGTPELTSLVNLRILTAADSTLNSESPWVKLTSVTALGLPNLVDPKDGSMEFPPNLEVLVANEDFIPKDEYQFHVANPYWMELIDYFPVALLTQIDIALGENILYD